MNETKNIVVAVVAAAVVWDFTVSLRNRKHIQELNTELSKARALANYYGDILNNQVHYKPTAFDAIVMNHFTK